MADNCYLAYLDAVRNAIGKVGYYAWFLAMGMEAGSVRRAPGRTTSVLPLAAESLTLIDTGNTVLRRDPNWRFHTRFRAPEDSSAAVLKTRYLCCLTRIVSDGLWPDGLL